MNTVYCPTCDSDNVEFSVVASSGDGDTYDEYVCQDCGEVFADEDSYLWHAVDGSTFDTEEEMWAWEQMLTDEDVTNE